jgi:hypothetical protein
MRGYFDKPRCLHFTELVPREKIVTVQILPAVGDLAVLFDPAGNDADYSGKFEEFQQREYLGVKALQAIVERQQHRLLRQHGASRLCVQNCIDTDGSEPRPSQPAEVCDQVLGRYRVTIGIVFAGDVIPYVVIGDYVVFQAERGQRHYECEQQEMRPPHQKRPSMPAVKKVASSALPS